MSPIELKLNEIELKLNNKDKAIISNPPMGSWTNWVCTFTQDLPEILSIGDFMYLSDTHPLIDNWHILLTFLEKTFKFKILIWTLDIRTRNSGRLKLLQLENVNWVKYKSCHGDYPVYLFIYKPEKEGEQDLPSLHWNASFVDPHIIMDEQIQYKVTSTPRCCSVTSVVVLKDSVIEDYEILSKALNNISQQTWGAWKVTNKFIIIPKSILTKEIKVKLINSSEFIDENDDYIYLALNYLEKKYQTSKPETI